MMERRITILIPLLLLMALIMSACQPDDVAPTPAGPVETVETPDTEAPLDDPAIPVTGEEWVNEGQTIYASQCATCHGVNGEGMDPQFPAQDGNPFVVSTDPSPVIDVVLHGREAMPAFADQLTNEEIAQVVSYIRNAWSNNASLVSEEEVQEIR
jgi:mono/diheme cytochrome c family protein